jgi:hypothetical protein
MLKSGIAIAVLAVLLVLTLAAKAQERPKRPEPLPGQESGCEVHSTPSVGSRHAACLKCRDGHVKKGSSCFRGGDFGSPKSPRQPRRYKEPIEKMQ